MSVEPVTTTATPATASPGLKGTKDEFLKLFMAQLQHQDPFAPTSGADMVAQLAQLSSVEQGKQMNDQLAELAAAQNANATSSLSNLVGRDCTATGGAFTIDDKGTIPPIDVTSASPTKGASVVIKNADGVEVRRIAIPDGTRATSIQWDGKDAKGKPVTGAFEMSIASEGGENITSTWHARVDSVELTPSGPRLRMGSLLVAPGDVRTIGATL